MQIPCLFSNVTTSFTPIIFNRNVIKGVVSKCNLSVYSVLNRLRFYKYKAKLVIDEITLVEAKNLNIKGWVLARHAVLGVSVVVDNEFVAEGKTGIPRSDVLEAFPKYDNSSAGFVVYKKLPVNVGDKLKLVFQIHLDCGDSIEKEIVCDFDNG